MKIDLTPRQIELVRRSVTNEIENISAALPTDVYENTDLWVRQRIIESERDIRVLERVLERLGRSTQ